MRLKRLIMAITFAFVFSGCEQRDKELQEQHQIVLGAVADAVETRALTVSPLPNGYRFRLYILPDGEIDPAKMVATRTYTITDDAGTPSLDSGQQAIKIAQDDYDFYVVGPLMGVDDKDEAINIASEVGVNVYAGNDIISSLTDVTVEQGTNNIAVTTLSHRMAKMQVVIERPTGATYEDLRVDEILLFDQPVTGSFAFGADGGSITADQTTFTRTYAPPVKESEDRYVATDYIFGHAKKDVKIETTFDAQVYVDGVLQTNTYYGQSGSVSTDIVVGNAYEITANPLVPTELLWRLKLVPWHDKREGSTSSIDRELICSFSGMDAPTEINGKQYWKDRSGNENHGELVGSVFYNTDEKYYTATQDEGSFIQLPALGDMENITVELVMSSAYNSKTTPFHATGKDGKTHANMHVPLDEADLYLDWGEADVAKDRIGPFAYKLNDLGFYEGMATWQYTRKVNVANVEASIYHNGALVVTENKVSRLIDFNDVKFLNGGNAATKLYSVRVYRTVLTPAVMANNAKNDKAVYAKISTDDHGNYVQKGLILDLRGADAPNVNTLVANRTVWQDRSMFGNHAEFLNGGPTHVDLTKGYKFAGNNQIMQLLRGLGDLSRCTIEVIMTAGTNKACDNLNFMDRTGASIYTFGGPNVKYTASFPGVSFKIGDEPSSTPDLTHMWSTVRNPVTRTVKLFQNGYAQATSNASQQREVTIPNLSLNLAPVTIAQIGGKIGGNLNFNGTIHAIRVYNRPLNDTERHMNYEKDKSLYNIPASSKYLPPVKGGLVFCYDGRHAPKTVAGVKYWVDEVAKNDAKIFGNVKYDAKDSYYYVPQNTSVADKFDYMQMVYPVSMTNDFTAEFTLKSDGPQPGSPIYWGVHPAAGATITVDCRYLYFHLPYLDVTNLSSTNNYKIFVDSPGLNRYSATWPTNVGEYTDVRKVVIRRKYNVVSEFFMYNAVAVSSNGTNTASTDISKTPCTIMEFGGNNWGGRFYSVRFYTRALSDAEMKENYDYDKSVFKFTDNK